MIELVLCLLLQQDPRELVEKLRSESARERDEASKQLTDLGEAARAALEAAAKDGDAEVSQRANRILSVLQLRRTIPPRLRKALPGLEEQLAAGGDVLWLQWFWTALGSSNRDDLLPALESEDLAFLAPRALRAAVGTDDQARVCRAISRYNLRSAIPSVIAMLSQTQPELLRGALDCLKDLDPKEAAAELVALVGGESAHASANAAQALWQMELRELSPKLTPYLASDRSEVRANAAIALEKCGTAEAITPLLPLLQDKDVEVQQAAIKTLAALGARQAVPALIAGMSSEDRFVRERIAEALAELGAKEAIPTLLQELRKEEPCSSAAAALATLGAKEAMPVFIRLLGDKEYGEKELLLPALARLGGRDGLRAIEACLKDEDEDIRRAAVKAIVDLRLVESAPLLVPLLKDDEGEIRERACAALSAFGLKTTRAAVLQVAHDVDAGVSARMAAILVLGRAGGKDEAAVLRKMLTEEDLPSEVVPSITHALANLGAVEAIPELRKALEKNDELVRESAIVALARLRAKEAAPDLIKLIGDDKQTFEIKRSAAYALGHLRVPEAIGPLRTMLEAEDFAIAAGRALAELGDRESVPRLVKMLRSEDAEERVRATDALAILDPKAAIDALTPLLQGNRAERAMAASGLCRLGVRDAVPALLASARGDSGLSLTPLNAIRLPERWKELRGQRRAFLAPTDSLDVKEYLEMVGGMPIEWEENGSSSSFGVQDFFHGWMAPLEALEEEEISFVLENDRVRFMSRHRQLKFWAEWWEKEGRK